MMKKNYLNVVLPSLTKSFSFALLPFFNPFVLSSKDVPDLVSGSLQSCQVLPKQ